MKDITGFLLFLLSTSTIGPLLFGYHLAELNAPQDVFTCKKDSISLSATSFLPQCIHMTSAEIGLVTSIFTIGGLCGALGAGPVASKLGRLRAMQYNTFFFIVGGAAEALAPSVVILAIGRLLSGVGAGAAIVTVPIYISEIAPPAKRGFFGAFTQIMTNLGIFTTQLLGLFLSKGQLWRVILAVGGGFGALQLLGLLFTVESPKWTAELGRTTRAKKILRRIRGPGVDVDEEVDSWRFDTVDDEREEEESLLQDDSAASASRDATPKPPRKHDVVGMLGVLLDPYYNRATAVVVVVMIGQQLSGVNSIIMYGVSLLSDLLTTSSALLNLLVVLVNLVVTLLCAPLIDYFGRKPCLMVSILGMGTSALFLAIAIERHVAALAATMTLTFIGSFGVGLGAIPFMLASELVGPEAVGAVQSWALAANWISTFVVSFFFPIASKILGRGKVYFFFTGIGFFFALYVAIFVPETKGRTADEAWGRTEDDALSRTRRGRHDRDD